MELHDEGEIEDGDDSPCGWEFECAKCGFMFPLDLQWWGTTGDYEGESLCPDCFSEELEKEDWEW